MMDLAGFSAPGRECDACRAERTKFRDDKRAAIVTMAARSFGPCHACSR